MSIRVYAIFFKAKNQNRNGVLKFWFELKELKLGFGSFGYGTLEAKLISRNSVANWNFNRKETIILLSTLLIFNINMHLAKFFLNKGCPKKNGGLKCFLDLLFT
jgi:hypothetical protein